MRSQDLFLNEIFGVCPHPGKVWGLQEKEHLGLRTARLHIWAPDEPGQVGACTSGLWRSLCCAKAHLESSRNSLKLLTRAAPSFMSSAAPPILLLGSRSPQEQGKPPRKGSAPNSTSLTLLRKGKPPNFLPQLLLMDPGFLREVLGEDKGLSPSVPTTVLIPG